MAHRQEKRKKKKGCWNAAGQKQTQKNVYMCVCVCVCVCVCAFWLFCEMGGEPGLFRKSYGKIIILMRPASKRRDNILHFQQKSVSRLSPRSELLRTVLVLFLNKGRVAQRPLRHKTHKHTNTPGGCPLPCRRALSSTLSRLRPRQSLPRKTYKD